MANDMIDAFINELDRIDQSDVYTHYVLEPSAFEEVLGAYIGGFAASRATGLIAQQNGYITFNKYDIREVAYTLFNNRRKEIATRRWY